jgi:hypothetical protein
MSSLAGALRLVSDPPKPKIPVEALEAGEGLLLVIVCLGRGIDYV